VASERRRATLRPVTARPTAGLWHTLVDATTEALRREHPHVGQEHVLYVLTQDRFFASLLEQHGVAAEDVRRDLDAMMSRPDYLTTGSNRVLDDEGRIVGHMFLGPDGVAIFEEIDPDEA
jgi:hypothetical protein